MPGGVPVNGPITKNHQQLSYVAQAEQWDGCNSKERDSAWSLPRPRGAEKHKALVHGSTHGSLVCVQQGGAQPGLCQRLYHGGRKCEIWSWTGCEGRVEDYPSVM